MADYDAKIRVSADTSAAERSLQNFETKLNGLVAGLDIGKKVGRSFTEAFVAPKQLKQLDRELATIASRADTVAKRFARVVEGVGTVGVAAKGISDVGDALQQLSVNAGQALDQVNNLAKLKQVLVPGFGAMQASISTLAKTISTLEYKFSSLVPGAQGILDVLGSIGPQASVVSAAVAAIGVAFETVLKGRAKQLETEVGTVLKTINDQTQQLLRNLEALNIPLSGTARQFQNLLRTGEERLANVSSYSDEARRALSTILTAEMRLTAELQRQAVLRREMEASRFASVAQRTGMQFTFGGPKALPMAGQTAFQGAMRGGLGGGARSLVPSQTEMLVNAAGGRASRSGIEARATTASLQFGTKLSTEVDKLNALSAAEKARTKEINARLLPAFNEQRVREGTVKILNNEVKLNESNLRIEQALNGERARGVRFLEKQTAEEQRQVQLGILGQKTNRLPGQIDGPGFPSAGPVPLGMYGQGRTPAGGRRGGGFGRAASGALSNAAVGGAFPLLFGQSGSAAAGGAIGGIAGSLIPGIGGFGGSLIGTILGEKLGQGNQVKQLGEDIGFSAEQTKMLGIAFQQAGRDFDKFQQSVQNIRGLSLAVDDQAKAIQLVSTLTKNYSGQIDKVTNAFTSALESGKVSQATLYQLTSQGIEVQQALADKYKVSRSAVLEMAKDGKISVQDLIDTLVELGNKGPAEITKNKTTMENLIDSVNNLGTALVNLGTNLVKTFGPIFKWLTDRVTDFINAISRAISRFGDLQFNAGKMTQITLKAEGTAQAATTKKYGLFARAYKPEAEAYFQQQRTNELKKLSPGSFKAKEKTKPLESFNAPSQMAATGTKDNSAEKAANAAAREAERIANIVRDQAAITEQKKLQAQYDQGLFVAEIAKDEKLKIQLQREQEIGEISLQYSKLVNDEKAKGNSAAVKEAFAKTALVNIQLVELKTAQDLRRLEIKKEETYANMLEDLQYELDLKSAVTEEQRRQLEIAYEMANLQKDPMLTDVQRAEIKRRKEQIDAPKTNQENIKGKAGQLQDELQQLASWSNLVITGAEAIGTAFSTSFKGIIDGSMTAQQALSSFFQSVASAFLDMAAQIIAKWITMTILNSVLALWGSKGSGGDLGKVNMAAMNKYSFAPPIPMAEGGFVTGPTSAIIGEGGQSEYIIPASKMSQAMSNYSAGKRGASILGDSTSMGDSSMGNSGGTFTLETVIINNVEYATVDQVRAMSNAAAKQGAESGFSKSMSSLRNSRSQRSRLGMR